MKRFQFLGAVFIFVILILDPKTAVSNAQRAMAIWYGTVAPSLFPFLALMPMLTSEEACSAYERIFSRWMRPLFHLPGSAAPAVVAGMIAGSPGGAIALRKVAANSNMTRGEAYRIALAVGGISPAYLIMGVGQGLHGSTSLGIKLAATQMVIQLLLLALLPVHIKGAEEKLAIDKMDVENKNPIGAAVEGVLCICGYMVFYSIIAGSLARFVGKGAGELLLLIMDLPSGLTALANSGLPLKMILQGAAIGFSGLCIISQNMNIIRIFGIEWRKYISVRLLAGMLFSIAGAAMEGNWTVKVSMLGENLKKSYAISLLTVSVCILPGLILLSKKLFLNKRKGKDFSS